MGPILAGSDHRGWSRRLRRDRPVAVASAVVLAAGLVVSAGATASVAASPTGVRFSAAAAAAAARVRDITLGGHPHAVAADSRAGAVWVATPVGVVVDPVRATVWITVLPDSPEAVPGWLAEVSESRHRGAGRFLSLSTGAAAAVDTARGAVWVADGQGTVSVIGESAHRVVRILTGVPAFSDGITIDPKARTVLISHRTSTTNEVWFLGESSGKVTRKIGVGFFPSALAVDPATGNVYVPIVFRGVVTQFRV